MIPVTLNMVGSEFVVRHRIDDKTVELVDPGALAAEIHGWSQALEFICRCRFLFPSPPSRFILEICGTTNAMPETFALVSQ